MTSHPRLTYFFFFVVIQIILSVEKSLRFWFSLCLISASFILTEPKFSLLKNYSVVRENYPLPFKGDVLLYFGLFVDK